MTLTAGGARMATTLNRDPGPLYTSRLKAEDLRAFLADSPSAELRLDGQPAERISLAGAGPAVRSALAGCLPDDAARP